MSEVPTAACPLHPLKRCSWLKCERCEALSTVCRGDLAWVCVACVHTLSLRPIPFYSTAEVCCVCREPQLLTLAITSGDDHVGAM